MFTRKQVEQGFLVEREHKNTYKWLMSYYKKYKRFPKEQEFFLHIVFDHLKENPEYYVELAKVNL